MPADWQPIKIEGGWEKGSMMIGLETEPVVLVKWWRPGSARFNPQAWLDRRFKDLHALPDPDAPHPDSFDIVGWLRRLERKDGAAKTVWYGHAPRAGLVMECISTSDVRQALRDRFFETLLPRLRAAAIDQPVQWSIFSAAFTSPPGYRLVKRHLVLGDIALDLRNADGHRLILRQVFPASLATRRRRLHGWLAESPFLDRRELRKPSSHVDDTRVCEQGWKRLPWPMGWLKPLYCDRLARVADDRIFIAEIQTGSPSQGDATRALETMSAVAGEGDAQQ